MDRPNEVVKVSVLGHSFVRRLHCFVRHQRLVFMNMEFEVGLYGIGSLKLTRYDFAQERYKPDDRLHSFDNDIANSDIVIVELGSNCLCDPHLGVFTFVSKLMEYATSLQTQLRIVAFSQILPRAESAQPFEGYNNKVVIVNDYIDYQLRVGGYTDIFFCGDRGLDCGAMLQGSCMLMACT